jgi:putative IMPACT (imprinted ancient) family translation regulator
MPKQSTSFDFGDSKKPSRDFVLHEKIITDRGSKYSVSFGRVTGKEDVKKFLAKLKANKKYAKATHNTWAVRITHDGAVYETKNDDGETGAGMVILRVMQKENVTDCIICVTRWFGGVKLMGDRFKHVQDATKYAIENTIDIYQQ